MSVPNIPSVMNGEGCPGCRTPIWGMRPKRCVMCGYDFDNPDPSQTLEARAETELKNLTTQAQGGLQSNFDTMQEVEVDAKARIEIMCTEFLASEWPEEISDGTTNVYTDGFMTAARHFWPEAIFYDVSTEVWKDAVQDRWHKRITGRMDLEQQHVVGFQFDYQLERKSGEPL
jgi:hypothetical protein